MEIDVLWAVLPINVAVITPFFSPPLLDLTPLLYILQRISATQDRVMTPVDTWNIPTALCCVMKDTRKLITTFFSDH